MSDNLMDEYFARKKDLDDSLAALAESVKRAGVAVSNASGLYRVLENLPCLIAAFIA